MAPGSPDSIRVLLERSATYGVIEVAGADRARWLHGLTSNDVKGLRPGEGNYALLLTGKGKITAELWVLCLEDRFLLVSRPEHRVRVAQTLDRYLLMDDVTLTDTSASVEVLGVHADSASYLAARAIGGKLPSREGHHVVGDSWPETRVLAVNEHGWPGYLFLVPRSMAEHRFAELLPCSSEPVDAEVQRIEHGVPRWGAELDEDTIPIEAGLESRAISYDKGCYVGQEIIARIKTYGEVAKKLWGVRWSGEGPVAAKTPFTRNGVEAGWVTSSAVSPKFGPISLAYVKRGHGEAGAEVRAADGRDGVLVSLPFAR